MLKKKLNFADFDPILWQEIKQEMIRQEENIELIASENYASPLVMQAQGSILTNKYAEGYPKKRYYCGCKYIDSIEQIAIDRAKTLFNADYANVQPHSGSQANFAVYSALLNPGDTIMGMNITHGGHLTHGSPVNFSGKLYKVIFYETNKNGEINYEELYNLAKIYKPKIIVGGFSSFSGLIDWYKMRNIADTVKSYLLADISHVAGLIVAGIYPNPISYAHVVTTTTHKTLAGPRGGLILAKGGNEEMYRNLNSSVFPGTQGGPFIHTIAAKAVALKEAMLPSFKIYQSQVLKNSQAMVKVFLSRGFSIISNTTYNHLFLLDLTDKNLTGKKGCLALSHANIITNMNSIPNDKRSPLITSGIRIGTPAITRRGFIESDACQVAHWICDILNNVNDDKKIEDIKQKVLNLCIKYPVYFSNREEAERL